MWSELIQLTNCDELHSQEFSHWCHFIHNFMVFMGQRFDDAEGVRDANLKHNFCRIHLTNEQRRIIFDTFLSDCWSVFGMCIDQSERRRNSTTVALPLYDGHLVCIKTWKKKHTKKKEKKLASATSLK